MDKETYRELQKLLRIKNGVTQRSIDRNFKREKSLLKAIVRWTKKRKLADTKLRKYRRRLAATRAARGRLERDLAST